MRPALVLAFLASASAFTAPVSRTLPVSRVSSVRAQFGTGNYDDSQSKPGFILSPIAGGSKVRSDAETQHPMTVALRPRHS